MTSITVSNHSLCSLLLPLAWLLASLSLSLWVSVICVFFPMSSFLTYLYVLVLDFYRWDADDRGLIPTHKTETLVPYKLYIPMYLCHLNNSHIHRHLIHIPLILMTSSPPPHTHHTTTTSLYYLCFVDPFDIRLIQLYARVNFTLNVAFH